MEINKRFDRILAVFIYLQSKRVVTGVELAQRFDVSLRTVYRDIRSLEMAGIPIYGEPGIGYSLVEGFRMTPVSFTEEEAMSFVVAEKLMKNYLDSHLSSQFSMALYKMKAMLRASDKDVVSDVEEKVLMRSKVESFNQEVPEGLSVLFRSISLQRCVSIRYQAMDAEEPSLRCIEPVGVFHEHSFWYFMAYCHLRCDYRQFRLDRVHEIKLLESLFENKHQPLEFYLRKDLVPQQRTIKISVEKDIVKYLKWDRDYYGFHSEVASENEVEMTFLCDNLDNGFARWYMMFGDKARILEPLELQQQVRELLTESIKKIT